MNVSFSILFLNSLETFDTVRCTDFRDRLFVMASLPDYHRPEKGSAKIPVDYNMSWEELCAATWSYYDQLVDADRSRLSGTENEEFSRESTVSIVKVLHAVARWFCTASDSDHNAVLRGFFVEFRGWLRQHVDANTRAIRLARGQHIDDPGLVLGFLLTDLKIPLMKPYYSGDTVLDDL